VKILTKTNISSLISIKNIISIKGRFTRDPKSEIFSTFVKSLRLLRETFTHPRRI